MSGELSSQNIAQQIITSYVDSYVQNELPNDPNKLRGLNRCMLDLYGKLKEVGLGREFYPLQATIGDIDPWAIGLNSNGEEDPFEQVKFGNLTERLGFDPEASVSKQVKEEQERIEIRYKKMRLQTKEPTWVPSRYYPEGAKGSEEARTIMAEEAKQIGLSVGIKDIWMGYGGMDMIQRAARAINTYFIDTQERSARLLTPSVGFNMAMDSVKQHGVDVSYVPTSDLSNNELTAERLEDYFSEGVTIPDVMFLTPANNPTAQSNNPEILEGVINKMIEKNKNIVFIFDMAYMWTIPREKALKIMEAIKKTGANKRSVFVISESKKMGRPGTRIGGAFVSGEDIKGSLDLYSIIHADTMKNEPSFSGELDTYYQALSKTIPESAYEDLSNLLHMRKRAILEVLKTLDEGREYFDEEIDRIVIPGDGAQRQVDSIEQDVPLYLWLRLKEGVSAFDVLKGLGICGAMSEVFGPKNGDCKEGYLRLSVGFASTSDILSKSKTVMARWKERYGMS